MIPVIQVIPGKVQLVSIVRSRNDYSSTSLGMSYTLALSIFFLFIFVECLPAAATPTTPSTPSTLPAPSEAPPWKTSPPRRVTPPGCKRWQDLVPGDFDKNPVWEVVPNGVDFDDVRPWKGKVPVAPGQGMFYVKTMFELADGSRLSGVTSPVDPSSYECSSLDVNMLHPFIWLPDGKRFFFWLYEAPGENVSLEELYRQLRRSRKQVFPARLVAPGGFVSDQRDLILKGQYYHSIDKKNQYLR